MKNFAILFFLIFLTVSSLTAFGQKPKTTAKKSPKPTPDASQLLAKETEEFEKAKAVSDPGERIAALQNFIKKFPNSVELVRAQGLIVSARAELADKKLENGETEAGIELFKLALAEAPMPISDELFTRVILGFPLSLYSRNQRSAAFDIVQMIEEKVGSNASQILDLAKFFITVQYGTEAIRLAEKAVALEPNSIEGLKTLAIAYRLNFRLEDAAKTYAKALEIDGKSLVFRQHLAEINRALGKPAEALALYREILEQDEKNQAAQAGSILALFNLGQRKEAETELTKSLEDNPNNVPLLVGVAYWYASQGEGAKAVEYAQKAIESDQQNVWAYIAQSRGLLLQNKPLEAEKALLRARQYGDFPTLDYELATVRLAAGFYREAAETLKRNFTVNQEGLIETYLGNRILADAQSFTELLSLERRVVLFEKNPADDAETSQKLKKLLVFFQKLEASQPNENEIEKLADEFVKGNDNFQLYRQIFVAQHLLQKKIALPKVLELTRAAIGGVEAALNVSDPTAAVLAEDLYATRQFFISRNQMLVVPTLPRQTLSAILRGRIEEIAGQTFYYQNNHGQAIVRLKKARGGVQVCGVWARRSRPKVKKKKPWKPISKATIRTTRTLQNV
jgi:tetratricopeptide (TPR) repeat protein